MTPELENPIENRKGLEAFPKGSSLSSTVRSGSEFQNQYTHETTISKLLRGLQLQLSGLFRMNLHYSYRLLVLLTECSYRNSEKFLQ